MVLQHLPWKNAPLSPLQKAQRPLHAPPPQGAQGEDLSVQAATELAERLVRETAAALSRGYNDNDDDNIAAATLPRPPWQATQWDTPPSANPRMYVFG